MRATLRRPIAAALALTLLALAALTGLLGAATAVARPATSHAAPVHTHPTAKPTKPATAPVASTPVTTAPGGANPAAEVQGSATNPNDSLVNNDVLNLSDPACSLAGMTVEQASRCLRTGDPAVPYPLGNYQMDIHMSTGLTHPINDVFTVLESVMNVVWMLLLYILKGALTLVSWAFSLSPFTNAATLGGVQNKLESVYHSLDNGWIDAVFVAIGAYGAYLAFVRRRQSEAIGHLGASAVAILLAIAIIHQPQTFIGKPAGFANSFAQDAISSANLAAHNRSGTVPSSKLASLTGDLFDTFATGPFCALETNDVSWCLTPPSKLEMKAAQRAVKGDHTYEKQAKAIAADVASRLPSGQQQRAYQAVYGSLTSSAPPARRADLFLRYPPGSTPRETLYALYSGENLAGKSPLGEVISSIISGDGSILKDVSKADLLAVAGDIVDRELKVAGAVLKYGVKVVTSIYSDIFGGGSSNELKPLAPNKIAIQGSSGLVQRSLVLVLTVLSLIGVLLVLVWLALHLVSQALLGFVLLFATPVMMLTLAFGASGRKAFGGWAKTLFGAIVSKAFYAAFLGVFVLALTALQDASTSALGPSVHVSIGTLAKTAITGVEVGKGDLLEPEPASGGGWGVPWVMQCLFCWAVFFKRNKIVSFFSIDPGAHQQSGSGSMAAMRVLGAAYAANRLGGAAVGAIKRPINAYRTRSLERDMGYEDATRDLAMGELEAQELDAAGRSHDHDKERMANSQNRLDRTGQLLDELKQNPDYKAYVNWQQSKASEGRVRKRERHAEGRVGTGEPAGHLPSGASRAQDQAEKIPDWDQLRRGHDMADAASNLEQVRQGLHSEHSEAKARVTHGEKNLHAHGQILSPDELSHRIEARRGSLARNKDDPEAWKRAENLELASGKHLTPDAIERLESRSQQGDRQAGIELASLRTEISGRMRSTERLLAGVPTPSQSGRRIPASDTERAASALRDRGKRDALDAAAERRRSELRTHRRRTRLFRAA